MEKLLYRMRGCAIAAQIRHTTTVCVSNVWVTMLAFVLPSHIYPPLNPKLIMIQINQV